MEKENHLLALHKRFRIVLQNVNHTTLFSGVEVNVGVRWTIVDERHFIIMAGLS